MQSCVSQSVLQGPPDGQSPHSRETSAPTHPPQCPCCPRDRPRSLLLRGHCLCCSIHLRSSLNQTFQKISSVRAQRATFSRVCLKWPLCLTLYSCLNSVPGPAPPRTEGEFLGAGVVASKAPVSQEKATGGTRGAFSTSLLVLWWWEKAVEIRRKRGKGGDRRATLWRPLGQSPPTQPPAKARLVPILKRGVAPSRLPAHRTRAPRPQDPRATRPRTPGGTGTWPGTCCL